MMVLVPGGRVGLFVGTHVAACIVIGIRRVDVPQAGPVLCRVCRRAVLRDHRIVAAVLSGEKALTEMCTGSVVWCDPVAFKVACAYVRACERDVPQVHDPASQPSSGAGEPRSKLGSLPNA